MCYIFNKKDRIFVDLFVKMPINYVFGKKALTKRADGGIIIGNV